MEKDKEKIQSENEGKRNEGSIAEPLKECLKDTREISDIEGKMTVIDEDVKEEVKVEDAEKMKEFLAVNHSIRPIIIALPSPFSTVISGFCCWNSNNHFEEGGQGLLMEKRPTASSLSFWAKNITQHRVYDPGICFHDPHLDVSLYFKLWDPSGHL